VRAHRSGVFGARIWAGVVAAPLIGLFIGWAASPLGRHPVWVRAVGSLIALYLVAMVFAVANAMPVVLFSSDPFAPRRTVVESIVIVLWALRSASAGCSARADCAVRWAPFNADWSRRMAYIPFGKRKQRTCPFPRRPPKFSSARRNEDL
jgi:hypothetical protein